MNLLQKSILAHPIMRTLCLTKQVCAHIWDNSLFRRLLSRTSQFPRRVHDFATSLRSRSSPGTRPEPVVDPARIGPLLGTVQDYQRIARGRFTREVG